MFLLIRFKIILQKQLLFQCPRNYETASFLQIIELLPNSKSVNPVYIS